VRPLSRAERRLFRRMQPPAQSHTGRARNACDITVIEDALSAGANNREETGRVVLHCMQLRSNLSSSVRTSASSAELEGFRCVVMAHNKDRVRLPEHQLPDLAMLAGSDHRRFE